LSQPLENYLKKLVFLGGGDIFFEQKKFNSNSIFFGKSDGKNERFEKLAGDRTVPEGKIKNLNLALHRIRKIYRQLPISNCSRRFGFEAKYKYIQ